MMAFAVRSKKDQPIKCSAYTNKLLQSHSTVSLSSPNKQMQKQRKDSIPHSVQISIDQIEIF